MRDGERERARETEEEKGRREMKDSERKERVLTSRYSMIS